MLCHGTRPNILFVISDQQRHDAVGHSNPLVRTPHLDNLVRSSQVFTHAFVQSPQCQPSRASIFTGRYPTAHRLWWNGVELDGRERTLGHYLQGAGYQTGYFGKLHFASRAESAGFQTGWLSEDWAELLTRPLIGTRGQVANPLKDEFHGAMLKPTWTGSIRHPDVHHEEIVTDRAVDFIRSARVPYLCVVGYHGPHPPYAAPDRFTDHYRLCSSSISVPVERVPNQLGYVLSPDEWLELKIQYYGSVSWIDNCLGRLLGVVDDDTIVVFTSDHGDILGDHGLFSKGMFAYDGNVRVPLVVRQPGRAPGVHRHLVESIDILPTLLRMAEVPVGDAVQGRGLWEKRDCVVSMVGHQPRLRMVRTERYKYWIVGDEERLFDLVRDRREAVDLVEQRPDLLSLMRVMLLRGLIRAEDPTPWPV